MQTQGRCKERRVEDGALDQRDRTLHLFRYPGKTLARSIWPFEDQTWPQISLGTALGHGLLSFPSEPQTQNPPTTRSKQGATRLHSCEDIRRRWRIITNKRLADDKIAATKILKNKISNNKG
ncbi:hypothetical protein BGW80DRAFT_1334467 [Lactifluus volemus]|nr:hypothetical protein BGW80DRAFT_1334467 [Lactifluus volemus]